MLALLQYLLDKVDYFKIIEALRKRNNREHAARLHLILVQAREILEIYRILLDELQAALRSHQTTDAGHRFYLNPLHIAALLQRQQSNLAVMDHMIHDLLDAVRILDSSFTEVFRSIYPGKTGILSEAMAVFGQDRFPWEKRDQIIFLPIQRASIAPSGSLGANRRKIEARSRSIYMGGMARRRRLSTSAFTTYRNSSKPWKPTSRVTTLTQSSCFWNKSPRSTMRP